MEVKFIKSSNDLKSCPKADLPEYAFIGRSNVGKSSLINMITGIKDLAKISSKPGKTKLINHFLILPLSNPDKIKIHKKDSNLKVFFFVVIPAPKNGFGHFADNHYLNIT